MRWPRSLTRAGSSPAPSRVKRASVSKVSCAPRLRKKDVILSGGVVREADLAAVEGPRRCGCNQECTREFCQRSPAYVLAKMPCRFVVARSSTGSFDSADSPLRGESAALRMTALSGVKPEVPINRLLPRVRLAFERGLRRALALSLGSRLRLCRQ